MRKGEPFVKVMVNASGDVVRTDEMLPKFDPGPLLYCSDALRVPALFHSHHSSYICIVLCKYKNEPIKSEGLVLQYWYMNRLCLIIFKC